MRKYAKPQKNVYFLLTLVLSFLLVACGETDKPRSPITVVSDHGAVSIDKEIPARWDTAKATITPEDGYLIESVTLNGANYTTKL